MMRIFYIVMILILAASPAFAIKDRYKNGSAEGKGQIINTPMVENVNLGQIQERFSDSDSRANYKEYVYDSKVTMKLRLREYMNTTVVLPKNENIKAFSLGESKNFAFSAVRMVEEQPTNIFEVWGKFAGADTSLKVFGESGNIYVFYLKIDSIASKEDPTLICYVTDAALNDFKSLMSTPDAIPTSEEDSSQYTPKKQNDKETDYLRSLPDVDPSKLNFEYEIADKESQLAPLRVFDDGNMTYFQFGENNLDAVRDLPVLYRVVDGVDSPWTNTQVVNGYVIATTTHEAWTLRSGRKWLCVRMKK